MALDNLKHLIPDYAKDQRRNLDALINTSVLTQQQLWGCLLVSAATSRNDVVLKLVNAEASEHLSDKAVDVALACTTAMTLNNYGFRAKHWLGHDFEAIRFGLRNGVSLKPGVTQADYELWAVAVSVVNGCEQCSQAHSYDAQEQGLNTLQVWEAVKIASVIQAIAQTIHVESVLQDGKPF
ncbi:MAG: carboxymuconolactone decarboxylase family protein [Corynebacterium casei]|nr:carboxymuconolactone decarboxylase family protein [Corynebacterium casei]